MEFFGRNYFWGVFQLAIPLGLVSDFGWEILLP